MAFAGASLVADGMLCASTKSAVDSGADSGYHLLVVEGYSHAKETTPNGKWIQSRPFIVGGRCWTIDYHPNGDDSRDEEFISVFLILEDDIKQSVKVQYVFSFIDQPELQVSKHIRRREPACFYKQYDVDGQFRFMKRESHFGDLLQSKEGADITFEVDGEDFAAHRCVLAARSTVFKSQLFGAMNESSVVKISDIKANVFGGLLTFIYTDAVPEFVDMEADNDDDEIRYATQLLQFLEAADRYDLQKLKSICEEKLAGFICRKTVPDIIVVAEQRRCFGLKEACLEFIKADSTLHATFVAGGLGQETRTRTPSLLKGLLFKFGLLKL
ncbi:BTB/POZ and MATH domain-containing protein 2-like [Hordeum vulgare subsp. vulgare]|uniref:BTB/POZ and MATH domain-containing protein 2-like n=1 Tax=Hordeum vulgare subsp. vulgare TaxID=112509 RepID=UPI001D1A4275|nr:BTB/POZ and MATH domain-containing protein 2-like [Hordeum vulgare subsp. vulgare]